MNIFNGNVAYIAGGVSGQNFNYYGGQWEGGKLMIQVSGSVDAGGHVDFWYIPDGGMQMKLGVLDENSPAEAQTWQFDLPPGGLSIYSSGTYENLTIQALRW